MKFSVLIELNYVKDMNLIFRERSRDWKLLKIMVYHFHEKPNAKLGRFVTVNNFEEEIEPPMV